MRIEFNRKGEIRMAHVPYGYKIESGVAMLNEPEANKIKQLFTSYVEFKSIKKANDIAGIDKTHSVVGRLLKNEIYLGNDYFPQIIDKDLFEKVQNIRNSNPRSRARVDRLENNELQSRKFMFIINKSKPKYNDPYKQAEYAYSQIEEKEV